MTVDLDQVYNQYIAGIRAADLTWEGYTYPLEWMAAISTTRTYSTTLQTGSRVLQTWEPYSMTMRLQGSYSGGIPFDTSFALQSYWYPVPQPPSTRSRPTTGQQAVWDMMVAYYDHLAQRSAYTMTMLGNSEWGPVGMMLEPNTAGSDLPTVQVSLVYSGTSLQGVAASPEQLGRTISATVALPLVRRLEQAYFTSRRFELRLENDRSFWSFPCNAAQTPAQNQHWFQYQIPAGGDTTGASTAALSVLNGETLLAGLSVYLNNDDRAVRERLRVLLPTEIDAAAIPIDDIAFWEWTPCGAFLLQFQPGKLQPNLAAVHWPHEQLVMAGDAIYIPRVTIGIESNGTLSLTPCR